MSGSDYQSEARRIKKILQGDSEELKKLYQSNYPSIANFIISNNGSEAEAKDIYQESIIVFYEKIQEEDFHLNCLIKTFLYSVARRLWLKRLAEKNRFKGKVSEFEGFLEVEDEINQAEENEFLFEKMEEALGKLGEPCKTILEDFYIHKQSMQAIADKMKYTSTNNAKTQKYKCLQRLKKIFFIEYAKQH